ncbi:hypothetical protein CCP3SC1AL1_3240005 [Gammaproteobacteria bacterium]
MIDYLPLNSSVSTPIFPNITNNSLPYINIGNTIGNFWGGSKCATPNSQVIITIDAYDLENDTIYYSYKCKDGDNIAPFTTNNVFSCTFNDLGNNRMGIFVNDTNHSEDYRAYYQDYLVTYEDCIYSCEYPSECTTINPKIVDLNNTDEGLLPTVYFGVISFITQPLPSMFVIFVAIIIVLFIGLIGTIISKIAKFGEG